MKVYLFTFVFFISISSFSQIIIKKIHELELDPKMKYKGKYISAVQWDDKNGSNTLILSETNIVKSASADKAEIEYIVYREDTMYSDDIYNNDKEIYAFNYISNGNNTRLLWDLIDYIHDCPYDLHITFLEIPPIVTDIDKDSIADLLQLHFTTHS